MAWRESWCCDCADARISSADSSLELTYYGLITQNTGEDWNEAMLASHARLCVPTLPA